MSDETAEHHDTLTPEQLAAVERARNTPYVISRSRRRPPGKTEWTFKPRIKLAREIDVVELLQRERQCTIATMLPTHPARSSE